MVFLYLCLADDHRALIRDIQQLLQDIEDLILAYTAEGGGSIMYSGPAPSLTGVLFVTAKAWKSCLSLRDGTDIILCSCKER